MICGLFAQVIKDTGIDCTLVSLINIYIEWLEHKSTGQLMFLHFTEEQDFFVKLLAL